MKCTINGLKWTIKNADADDSVLQFKGNPCFGVTEYPSLTIYLRKDQAKELYRQTSIHELIHAFTFSFGVHLMANEKTEESVCDFMGAHFDEIYHLANLIMENVYGKG